MYERLLKSVSYVGDCWVSNLSKVGIGYAKLEVKGKTVRAHRVMYECTKGPIPPGMVVRHTCDNPACINPDHLIIGTHKDNSQDMVKRGRQTITRYAASLTEEQVRDIKRNPQMSAKALAAKHGVTQWAIFRIRRGDTWGHIIPIPLADRS